MFRVAAIVVLVAMVSSGCTAESTETSGAIDGTPESVSTVATQAPTTATTSTTTMAESSTTTTQPPTVTTTTTTVAPSTTTTTLAPVDQVASGLFCRDLHALGYGYPDGAAYWLGDGSPDRMDADRNGVPCQTVYPEVEVIAYWGEPLPVIDTNEFAFLVSIEMGSSITVVVDYAQWFLGDAATRACEEDGEDEYCPYEGYYYIRNVNPRLRTLAVSDDAAVFLGDWHGEYGTLASEEEMRAAGLDDHPTMGCRVPLEEVRQVLDSQHDASPEWHLMVWLATDGETVTAIQEQYVP
jgi:hypothetical protein